MPQSPHRRIAVLGSISMDLIARVPRLPKPGETVLGAGYVQLPGGKGANQAVACARLGAEVAMIGRVGRDAFGDALQASLAREGIDTSFVYLDDSAPSGVALIGVSDATGENSIIVAPGANGLLSVADVEAAWVALSQANVLLCSLEVPLATVEAAAAIADQSETLVIVNPAPAPASSLPVSLLQRVAILTPNETEAEMLAGFEYPNPGHDPLQTARALVAIQGVPIVVMTLGADGALALHPQNDQPICIPAVHAGAAVDTIGAGDCYSAALAVALGEQQPLPEAMRFAATAAAISVTRPGAQGSMPAREEVDALIRKSGSLSG